MSNSGLSLTFELAGLTWHIKRRSFWATSEFLAHRSDDYQLSRYATLVWAVSGGDRLHELEPEQARAVIAKLTGPQLLELEQKVEQCIDQLDIGVEFSFDIPKPFPVPHWKSELSAADKLKPEQKRIISDIVRSTEEELRDEHLMEERVDRNYAIVLKGLEKAKLEEKEAEKQGIAVEELIQDTLDKLKYKDEKDISRVFALSEVIVPLMPLISQNLFTVQGTCGSNKLTLRYVSKKEIAGLAHICQTSMERERCFCALSIASINGTWCLSSYPPSQAAYAMVDSWTDVESPKVYDTLLKLRSFVDSLLFYVEALPYVKLTRDFWDINYKRDVWWADHYTGIPGTGSIPPNEVVELFIQECLIEERAIQRITTEDTLSLQVAGLSHDLAKAIQHKNNELIKVRNQQINYMLFKELPETDTKEDGSFSIPSESTREELIAVAENAIKGGVDYHDLMAILLQRRKAVMEKKMVAQAPIATMGEEIVGFIDGRSYVASMEEVSQMQHTAREERAALDEATLEFSQDAVENIMKSRKRALLVKGIDPYNKTDQSIDWGSAEHISRTKNNQ